MRRLCSVLVALAFTGCLDLGSEAWELDALPSPGGHDPGARGGGGGGGFVPAPLDDSGMAIIADGGEGGDEICPHADGPQEARVFMVANKFEPSAIEICAGDTVTWENRDTKEHTVYTGTPEDPDGMIATEKIYFGETFSFTFENPDDYLYYCTTHKKKMRDALVVVH